MTILRTTVLWRDAGGREIAREVFSTQGRAVIATFVHDQRQRHPALRISIIKERTHA